jgi:hypothetical protein
MKKNMHDLSNGNDTVNVLLGYLFMGNPHEGENDFTGMYYPVSVLCLWNLDEKTLNKISQ